MSEHFNFNQNPDLQAMKQDIADRSFRIKMKGMLITGAFAAVAIGALFLFPLALGAATPVVGLLAAAGSGIAGLLTLKETKKLQIDEEFLQTRMQGKNWWGGYREEVGTASNMPQAPLMSGPAPSKGGTLGK